MTETIMPNIEKNVNIHLENKYESRKFFWFIWILYSVVCMTKNCYNAVLANIVAEGILTKSQTGFINAMFYVVYTPLQVIGGMYSDRFSPERMIKFGLVGAAIANIVIFFNQNYYVMLAAWMFNGLAQFGIWPSVFKIVSSQLVRSERVNMASYISFTTPFGFFMSYLIAAFVPSWKYNFAISSVSLLLFAVILHFFEKHLNPYMKWDKEENTDATTTVKATTTIPAIKVFLKSAFFFVLIASILEVTVNQSRSALNSVMLIENYDNVSPSLGNILTSVFLICGIFATIIAQKFSGKIKNEVATMIIIYTVMIPFLCVCMFVGKIQVSLVVVSMCVVASGDAVFTLVKNYYNMHFIKYGLNGTAAGILNAGNAFSFMIASYVFPLIVENFGWTAITLLWPMMILIAVIILFCGLRKFNKFAKNGL